MYNLLSYWQLRSFWPSYFWNTFRAKIIVVDRDFVHIWRTLYMYVVCDKQVGWMIFLSCKFYVFIRFFSTQISRIFFLHFVRLPTQALKTREVDLIVYMVENKIWYNSWVCKRKGSTVGVFFRWQALKDYIIHVRKNHTNSN